LYERIVRIAMGANGIPIRTCDTYESMHPRAATSGERLAMIVALWITPAVARAQTADDAGTPSADTPAKTEPAPPPVVTAKQPEPEREIAPAEPHFTWMPFGYLRLQYIAVQDDPNVAFVGRDDGFELQNARVGVIGRLGAKAAFQVSIDGAVDERAQINSPDGKLRVGLRGTFGDVVLSGAAVVRAGYFQAWVDPLALQFDTEREFVDRPIESRGMRATEGWQTPGLAAGHSLGAAIRLDPAYLLGAPTPVSAPRVGFEVAIQNGADEFASNNDNDQPALSASLIARFAHNGWALAAGRWNPRTIGDLPFRQDETDFQGIFGAHVAAGPVSLEGGGVVMHTIFESTNGPSQDAYGAHAQIMLTIPASLPFALGYRFGVLDPSNRITTDQVMEHTVGAVLGVPSYRMRVQLQLTHVQEQAARDLSNDRAQLAAELDL
jgi:hypothetical protein